MTQDVSEKCTSECEYFEQGSLGTKFCTWCSELCPKKGCFKEEQEKREMNGEVEYFFAL